MEETRSEHTAAKVETADRQTTDHPGQPAEQTGPGTRSRARQEGSLYGADTGQRHPAAREYYREGRQAVGRYVGEAPLTTMIAVAALGYVAAWAFHGGESRSYRPGRRTGEPAPDLRGVRTGKPLIESDRVEGTAVYDLAGNRIGTIRRLMIEKVGGRVAYAVLSFGGFLGLGAEEYAIPWRKLDFDTELEGYRTDITEEQLRHAPALPREVEWDWSDRAVEQGLHDYWRVSYYWLGV